MPQGRGSSRTRTKSRRNCNRQAGKVGAFNIEGTSDLQIEALQKGASVEWPSSRTDWEEFDFPHLDLLRGLAEQHGYMFIGAGSTRFVVRLTGNAIAKVAWTVSGLVQNLNSAAIWLGSSPEVRHRLAPCLAYAPAGVLVQQYVDGISPRSTKSSEVFSLEEHLGRAKAVHEHLNEINEVERVVFGLGPRTEETVRLDNYGKSPEGHLVAVDYGHNPTDQPQTAWVLSRSADEVLPLVDAHPRYALDLRIALERGAAGLDDFLLDSTIQDLSDRAGWPGPTDVCGNCDSGFVFHECCGKIELRGLVAGV